MFQDVLGKCEVLDVIAADDDAQKANPRLLLEGLNYENKMSGGTLVDQGKGRLSERAERKSRERRRKVRMSQAENLFYISLIGGEQNTMPQCFMFNMLSMEEEWLVYYIMSGEEAA